ncbi:MAG: orotate phosphoribosyltransferase [Planctomycetia bacterium]|nr:orotate phosphoribosyltransferase [Planctomycetia bacterium]
MQGTKDRLLQLLRERAVRHGKFTLASGEQSDYYIDGRLIEVHPEGATLIGEAIYERIKDLAADAIGGLAVGAVPLATATVVACHRHGLAIEGFWVRADVKDHGTRKLIEGNFPDGARTVIVDDVITSGDSVQRAIDAVQARGGKIVRIVTMVDRQRGAKERFEQAGYVYDPLFTKDELLAVQGAR